MRRGFVLLLLALLLAPNDTGATYSIVAVEKQTRRFGVAAVSCYASIAGLVGAPLLSLWIAAPSRGVLAAQASAPLYPALRKQAGELLAEGMPPRRIVQELLADRPRQMAQTQLGVVDLRGRVASFTGKAVFGFACDASKPGCGKPEYARGNDDPAYTVQGNMLTGPSVLDEAAKAFASGGCDLAERLMVALEAGAGRRVGELQGDARCTGYGVAGDAGFLRVQGADGTPVLELTSETACGCPPCMIPGPRCPDRTTACRCAPGADAVTSIRARYDAWRLRNPCPTPRPAREQPPR